MAFLRYKNCIPSSSISKFISFKSPNFYRPSSSISPIIFKTRICYFSSSKNNSNSVVEEEDVGNNKQNVEETADNTNQLFGDETVKDDISIEETKKLMKSLREENKQAVEKAKDLQSKLIRCYADQENSRKRFEKEIENIRNYSISDFAKSILPIADNLSLAVQSIDPNELEKNDQLKQIFEGVRLTETTFHSSMAKFGVEKFESIGEKFDPALHEALFEMEDAEKDKGSVGRVVQSGYKIKDRILRAAKVGVVKRAA